MCLGRFNTMCKYSYKMLIFLGPKVVTPGSGGPSSAYQVPITVALTAQSGMPPFSLLVSWSGVFWKPLASPGHIACLQRTQRPKLFIFSAIPPKTGSLLPTPGKPVKLYRDWPQPTALLWPPVTDSTLPPPTF